MPSMEFLLYLVIVVFVAWIIMNYYKDSPADPEIQYKYIPVYGPDPDKKSKQSAAYPYQCNNRYCMQYGACQCNGNNSIEGYGYVGSVAGSNNPVLRNPGPGPVAGPVGPLVGPGAGPGPVAGPGSRVQGMMTLPPPAPIDPLRKFDHDAVYDEFTPPFRRSYYDEYNYYLHPGLYPTYTRGPPGRFRKIGTLIAQGVAAGDRYKFLNMMGRQKYNNRDYEYYATSTAADQRIKFYIETKGKEINDGDIVTLHELDGYTYRFKEDPDLSPRYDPYIV
jgi:hypothetical protein